jgi:hypothetical protein
VRETTFAFSRKLHVGEAEVARYFREVQAEALEHRDELQDSMAESAVLIWTSAKRLTLQPGTTIEFCSLLNRILREHDPDLLPSACVVVRGINLLCVMRRDETKLLYPPGGVKRTRPPPPPDAARCTGGNNTECVGGMAGVIVLQPPPAASAAARAAATRP